MKKTLLTFLFSTILVINFSIAQSIEFTSAELTTATLGSTVKVDYKYTIAADGYIYCAIELLDDWTWNADITSAELNPAVAGTDVTGSFNLVIPDDIALTADLTGNLNYKLKIELKQDPNTWLTGQYPATQINITAATASINDAFLSDVHLYPNPAKDFIQFTGIENITIAKVIVTNVLGKEVLNTTPQDAKIDISNLNSGIYMVSIQTENASKNIKLIKQ